MCATVHTPGRWCVDFPLATPQHYSGLELISPGIAAGMPPLLQRPKPAVAALPLLAALTADCSSGALREAWDATPLCSLSAVVPAKLVSLCATSHQECGALTHACCRPGHDVMECGPLRWRSHASFRLFFGSTYGHRPASELSLTASVPLCGVWLDPNCDRLHDSCGPSHPVLKYQARTNHPCGPGVRRSFPSPRSMEQLFKGQHTAIVLHPTCPYLHLFTSVAGKRLANSGY
jgi:hypothetical protein